jgi:hypothetical protein
MLLELLNVNLNLAPNSNQTDDYGYESEHVGLKNFPSVHHFHERMISRSNIQQYLQSGRRPARVNGKGAYWDGWTEQERLQRNDINSTNQKWF